MKGRADAYATFLCRPHHGCQAVSPARSSSPTMPSPEARPPLTLTVAGTTVRFAWHVDRWTHDVLGADGTRWRSIEETAVGDDPRWPASPVLVELSALDTPAGRVILGVGLAGRSHFSASVGPDPAAPDRLRFDLACRVNEPPPWLGSTYRDSVGLVRIGPGPLVQPPPTTVQWAYAFGSGGLVPLAGARVEPRPD
jgi:hypothetical protein